MFFNFFATTILYHFVKNLSLFYTIVLISLVGYFVYKFRLINYGYFSIKIIAATLIIFGIILSVIIFSIVKSNFQGKKIDEILPSFKTHWNTLSMTDFEIKRSIKRVELAAILNEYDVFNQFKVDVFGFYIK